MNYNGYLLEKNLENQNIEEILGVIMGFIIMFFMFFFTIALIFSIINIIINWQIFKKAGEKGWKAIIPIYNSITLLKIVGINPLWLLLYLAPFASILIYGLNIYTHIKLSKSFEKDDLFTVGLILFSPIFMGILAFGNSKYVGKPYVSKSDLTKI